MPLPSAGRELPAEITSVGNELADIETALGGLPATPLEADLPAIVQIVADLQTATSNLRAAVDKIGAILSTTRVNQ